MSVILSTRGVCRDFKIGDGSIVSALKNINIEIEQGKLTVLRGRSGSGKTTLINILGALDKPTREMCFSGSVISPGFQREQGTISGAMKWLSFFSR